MLYCVLRSEVMLLLGVEIKKKRVLRGYSQRDFARNLGISRATLQRWESGATEPTASQVVLIANSLQFSCDEILGFDRCQKYGCLSKEVNLKTLQRRLCDLIGAIEKLHSECDTPEEVMRLLLDVGDNGEINHPENRAFIDLLETLAPLAGEILRSIRRGERIAS